MRTGEVMGKADTRELARNYMLEELPSRTKIVVDAVAIRQPYDVPLLGIERTPDQPEFFPRFGAPPKKDNVYPPDPVRTERFIGTSRRRGSTATATPATARSSR